MSGEEKQDEQFLKYPYIADAEISEKSLKDVLQLPDGIEVRKSPLAGYGVFATRDIKEGETLEEACYAPIGYRTQELTHNEMRKILYPLPCGCESCKFRGNQYVVLNGYCQVYNHSSENPSAQFQWFTKSRFVRVRAITDIKKDSEIFVSYGNGYNSFTPVNY